MRILLVEDDPLLGNATQVGLTNEGYTVEWIKDGAEAKSALECNSFDGVVLDLGLPGLDGLDLLFAMRKNGDETPVLVLTARDSINDRVKGLDAGSDDYLIKPFDLDELNARLRAIIRRASGRASPAIVIGGVSLDPVTHKVVMRDKVINLSQREFALLQMLMEGAGRVLSRSHLEEHLYGWNEDIESNSIEVHIHNLRKKLGKEIIKTIRGVGYTMSTGS